MSIVESVVVRIFVDSLEKALPTYAAISGDGDVRRISTPDGDVAAVGVFLLLEIPADKREKYTRQATLYVNDIEAAQSVVTTNGGEIIDPPALGPYGWRMLARHVDGYVYEYCKRVDSSDES